MGRRNKKGDPVSGWINLDKPLGMTSTQAVGKVRRALNAQKVGHAGTLDPLASGILPIALGEATKTIPFAQDADKAYEFTVSWGEQRTTDDAEGDIIAQSDLRPEQSDIEALIPRFIGTIEQLPPQFSALKVDGQRAYDLARYGQKIELKTRQITIESLELLTFSENSATFTLTCGKGTYVRSIARDMGEILGCCGYISALRRTRVGNFKAQSAISLDKLEEQGYKTAQSESLLPLETVLDDIPALVLNAQETADLRNGRALSFISKPDFQRLIDVGLGKKESQTALVMFQGNPVALVEQERAGIKPVRVFNI